MVKGVAPGVEVLGHRDTALVVTTLRGVKVQAVGPVHPLAVVLPRDRLGEPLALTLVALFASKVNGHGTLGAIEAQVYGANLGARAGKGRVEDPLPLLAVPGCCQIPIRRAVVAEAEAVGEPLHGNRGRGVLRHGRRLRSGRARRTSSRVAA